MNKRYKVKAEIIWTAELPEFGAASKGEAKRCAKEAMELLERHMSADNEVLSAAKVDIRLKSVKESAG